MKPFIQNSIHLNSFSKNTILEICCPNCGSCAERHFLASDHLIRTQCPTCDYLMITCSETGKVVEAYAPGIYAPH
ncbi:replication restart DNA helicase PriA [Kovacikia minuta CCNUW1]|nr:replication restart DNA helicase PriA [Kovacikia minuta]UBF26653.1 replication restart DNA helicase PriA [Kovacikia minuta CCNUW1]